MSILVVGGDKLGSITQKLSETGFSEIQHISGRKYGDRKTKIPFNADIVLVLTDFIEHALMRNIKKESKKSGVKLIFSKRSWTHMEYDIKNSIKDISNA